MYCIHKAICFVLRKNYQKPKNKNRCLVKTKIRVVFYGIFAFDLSTETIALGSPPARISLQTYEIQNLHLDDWS